MAGTKKIYTDLYVKGTLNNNGFSFPESDGTNGQALLTTGTGSTVWGNISGATSGCCLDVFVTGGTYTGTTIVLTNTTGGTVSITGITGGGTGSTFPGGNNTHVQWNNGGLFDGTSGLTWDGSEQFNVVSDYSGSTQKLSIGKANLAGLADYDGVGMSYKNPLSAGTSGLWSGNLSAVSGQDNHSVLGYADLMSNTQNLLSISASEVGIQSTTPSESSSFSMLAGDDTQIQLESTGTTAFIVRDGIGNRMLQVNTAGDIIFNDNYTFPQGDGSNGQVLSTDGGGNVSWENAASGGTGGTSIMIVGVGSNSTIRDNVGNTASGYYSAALGGGGNVASGNYSFVGGGHDNTASNYCATVGGGKCNIASGNTSTVSGGYQNTAGNSNSAVGGGIDNTASGYYAVIGGGAYNTASGAASTVAGGSNNASSGQGSFIGGGWENTASGAYSVIGGGLGNTASGCYTSVLGGQGNTASGNYSSVLGGQGLSAGTNTSAVPNLDINGDIRLIGTSTATEAFNGSAGAVPSSAATYVTITLDGSDYLLPLFSI